jgi:hypothetical protein
MCKAPLCNQPALKWDLCTAHLTLFAYLLDDLIDIPEFDRLMDLPTDTMLKELNRRFALSGQIR